MGEDQTIKHKVEALLFASGRSMDIETIAELAKIKVDQTKTALEELKREYDERQSALFIWNEGVRWKINVREEYTQLVVSITAETELTKPVMATLALIAYRTPVMQAEVIKSRGDGAYAHIAELVDKDFVTKEKMGRSFKLKTTDKFYNYFNVTGDKDIQKALEKANPKDVKKPRKLGELDVVDADTDFEAELEKRKRDTQMQVYDIEKQRENDKGFLNDFDGRLDGVKKNISTTEKELDEHKTHIEEEREQETADGEDPEAVVRAVEEEIKALTHNTDPSAYEDQETDEEESTKPSSQTDDSEQSPDDSTKEQNPPDEDQDEEEKK